MGIAQRKYAKSTKGKIVCLRKAMIYEKNHPDKVKARKKLHYIFSYGNISNDNFICAICGKQPIDKHHENYDLWYVFIPLCRQCHVNIGRMK